MRRQARHRGAAARSDAGNASSSTMRCYNAGVSSVYLETSFFSECCTIRTSEIARVLTVLSGIFLPLTLITGIYGMNFEHMPELKWRSGYFITLGELVVVGLGLYFLFRRLGWVGKGRSLRRR